MNLVAEASLRKWRLGVVLIVLGLWKREGVFRFAKKRGRGDIIGPSG